MNIINDIYFNVMAFSTDLTISEGQSSAINTEAAAEQVTTFYNLIDKVAYLLIWFVVIYLAVNFISNMLKAGDNGENRLEYVSRNVKDHTIYVIILLLVWSGAVTFLVGGLFRAVFGG